MSIPLATSIRAGLCIQSSQALAEAGTVIPARIFPVAGGDETGALGEPAPHLISAGAVSPFHRRAGRRFLRLLKPLAAPLLHRIDMRTRSSVDQSGAAAVLRGIDAKLDALRRLMDARLGAMAAQIDREQRIFQRVEEVNSQRVEEVNSCLQQIIQYNELLLQRNVIPLGEELVVRTAAGYLFVPAEDPALLVAVVETGGRLEPGSLAVVLSLLKEGGVLVDVGANIGTFTLPAARRVGARGHVLAMEPAPRVVELLRRTVALNEVADWIEVRECAAGEANGTVLFGLSRQTTHNSLQMPDDTVEQIEVPIRRLDDLIGSGRQVDVVKIDVEGAELQVWRGMQRIVAENPQLAIVLEFGPEHIRRAGNTVPAWFEEMTSAGHNPWEIDEALAAVRPLRQMGIEEVFSLNILLIRDDPRSLGLSLA
jgi:FkbM family methyltransferase